jgi:hypothetical protein
VAVLTLLSEHALYYALKLLLTALDGLWRTHKVFPGDGEVAAPVVSLKASLAVTSLWQLGLHEDVNTSAGRANLRVRVEGFDNLLSPALYLSALRVQTAVQVHSTQAVLGSEHEAHSTVAMLLADSHGFLIVGPGLRVRSASPLTRERRVGNLARLAVALLRAPHEPLSKVSHTLRVCYHVF